jgi:hypothetical protein
MNHRRAWRNTANDIIRGCNQDSCGSPLHLTTELLLEPRRR